MVFFRGAGKLLTFGFRHLNQYRTTMKGIYVPVGIMRISVIFPDICLYSLYFSLRHVISEGNTMLRILLEVCRFL